MAAKTPNSDLDMAFNLQMQEAITASLALNPPPSPSNSNDAVLDLSTTTTLMLLDDFERFAQDSERTVLETLKKKKTKEDLLNCTDGASSSSLSKAAAAVEESKNLRLYCKGLVSEESVRGTKVVVAGAGVALCDPRDNLIFEARKNLEAVVDG